MRRVATVWMATRRPFIHSMSMSDETCRLVTMCKVGITPLCSSTYSSSSSTVEWLCACNCPSCEYRGSYTHSVVITHWTALNRRRLNCHCPALVQNEAQFDRWAQVSDLNEWHLPMYRCDCRKLPFIPIHKSLLSPHMKTCIRIDQILRSNYDSSYDSFMVEKTEWGSPTNCGLIHQCHIIILVHVKRPVAGEEEAMNESHSEIVLIIVIVMMMIFISRVLLESGHSTALFYILRPWSGNPLMISTGNNKTASS